jgi:hypothetical protein
MGAQRKGSSPLDCDWQWQDGWLGPTALGQSASVGHSLGDSWPGFLSHTMPVIDSDSDANAGPHVNVTLHKGALLVVYQSLAANKSSLISIVVVAQATTRKHRIARRAPANRNVVCVQPQEARVEAISSRRRPKEGSRRENDGRRPTQQGLGFHPRNLLRGMKRSKKIPQRRLQGLADAVCVAFLRSSRAGAFIIFSRASPSGVSTAASSCELFSAAADLGRGRTTSVFSFGLSSSLRKIV